MNDKVFEFAKKQNDKMFSTFMKKGFDYLDFPEVVMCIAINSFTMIDLLKNGIHSPTEKQIDDASIKACDDVIKFCIEHKSILMNEEG